jgi:hypothetical protein
MNSLQKNNKQFIKRSFSNLLVVSSLLIPGVATLSTIPISAASAATPVTSMQKVPYSRLFYTGAVYAVKDQDFDPSDAKIGFFSVWSKNPKNNHLQVAVRYCLNDPSITEPGTYLTKMTVLNHNQPLVNINREVKETAAEEQLISPGYYETTYAADPFWMDDPFFWDPLYEDMDYAPPIYIPPTACSAGFSRFDITKLADKLAQLPDQTLQVQLTFSNGETQTWRLGKGTVQALKQLVAAP